MKLKDSSKFFNALADETRLRILSLLAGRELCVCDIMGILKEPQSKVSRHLATMRRAGLVEAERKGLWMHYRLLRPRERSFRLVLEALSRASAEFPELEKDAKEYRKKKRCLPFCTTAS